MFKDQKNNLHHAYLIEGNKEKSFSSVLDFVKNDLGIDTKNNPDFWCGDFDTFGIDDGRKINDLQSKMAVSGGKKIFVIKTNFITREAQNSLLKMFEEPTRNTHFFIITNSSDYVLPTLKSRLMILSSGFEDNLDEKDFAKKFLSSNMAERIDMIGKFFGDTKKKIPADKIGAINFLNALEGELRQNLDIKNATKNDLFVFDEIIKCRSYLNDRSPSVKMLLEHMATILL